MPTETTVSYGDNGVQILTPAPAVGSGGALLINNDKALSDAVDSKLPLSGGTLTGDLNLGSNNITNFDNLTGRTTLASTQTFNPILANHNYNTSLNLAPSTAISISLARTVGGSPLVLNGTLPANGFGIVFTDGSTYHIQVVSGASSCTITTLTAYNAMTVTYFGEVTSNITAANLTAANLTTEFFSAGVNGVYTQSNTLDDGASGNANIQGKLYFDGFGGSCNLSNFGGALATNSGYGNILDDGSGNMSAFSISIGSGSDGSEFTLNVEGGKTSLDGGAITTDSAGSMTIAGNLLLDNSTNGDDRIVFVPNTNANVNFGHNGNLTLSDGGGGFIDIDVLNSNGITTTSGTILDDGAGDMTVASSITCYGGIQGYGSMSSAHNTLDDGSGNMSLGGKLTVNYTNTNYTNTAGAGSHLLLSNPSASGQNVVCSIINGAVVAKWRTDYVGNISWVAGTTGAHTFYTQGDYGTGSYKLNIANNGFVGIGTNYNGTCLFDVNGTFKVNGSSQIGFYGTSPVSKPTAATTTSGFTASTGTTVVSGSTFTGNVGSTAYTIGDIVKCLKTLGLITA